MFGSIFDLRIENMVHALIQFRGLGGAIYSLSDP